MNNWKLLLGTKGPGRSSNARSDYSDAVRTIRDFRQKDEQKVKPVTVHRTRMMHHRRIIFSCRAQFHPMHMHWLKRLTAQDELHLSVRVII